MLVLLVLPTSSSKLLAKWQGPFLVTRRVGDLDYEVKRMDRGDSCQIYHLNLLKRWNEVTSVELAAAVSAEEDLGPEAAVKTNPLALVPGGDHLSQHPAPYRNNPRGSGAQPSLSFTRTQEKSGSG